MIRENKEMSRARAAGFGPCADYMWPEIEEVYATSDKIDKDLIMDIYWHEPGIHREILALRRELMRLVKEAGDIQCNWYGGFNKMWKIAEKMGNLNTRFEDVLSEANARKGKRDAAAKMSNKKKGE